MNSNVITTVAEAEQRLQRAFFSRYPLASIGPLEQMETVDQVEIFERQPVAAMLPVWERLSPDIGQKLLAALPAEVALAGDRTAKEVREALHYPPDSAGSLMDTRARLFRVGSTVVEVLARLREDRRPGRSGFFVVDSDNHLLGRVDMQDLALAGHDETVDDLVQPVEAFVQPMTTREEVGETLEEHRLSELAVVDLDGRLIGVIRHAAIVESEKERASVGIQTMVGVSKDERATSSVGFAVRKRLPWLQINLVTAFVAAAVWGCSRTPSPSSPRSRCCSRWWPGSPATPGRRPSR